MSARKWSNEQRAAASAQKKAEWAVKQAAKEAARIAAKSAAPTGTVMPEIPAFTKSLAAPKVEVRMTHPETGMGVPHVVKQEEVKPEPAPIVQKLGEADPAAPPPNLFSGRVKRLEVHPLPGGDPNDPIPGYRLYWFHDVDGGLEIARAQASGYRFVERDEIGLNDAQVSPGNNDLGTHVRRWVDSGGPNGQPIFAFLMKKPNWLAELHDAELEKVHQMQEAQLNAGNMNNQLPANVRHTPSVGISTKTSGLYKP